VTLRHLSRAHRLLRRTLLTAAYLTVLVAGISMLVLTPRTIAGALGEAVIYLAAGLAVIGGPAGAWSVATDRPGRDRWRVERWAAPLAAGGALGYAVGVWSLIAAETITRMSQGAWIATCLLLLIDRAVEVDATAKTQRVLHDLKRGDPRPPTTDRG
jgi:hypothetical protein